MPINLMFEETSEVAHNQNAEKQHGEGDWKCEGQQMSSAWGLWALWLQMDPNQSLNTPLKSKHTEQSLRNL